MTKYKETTVSGTSYIRSNKILINNGLHEEKSITFNEEKIVTLDSDSIAKPYSAITETLNSDNINNTFNLITEINGSTSMKYQDVYTVLNSLYMHLAELRDNPIVVSQPTPVEVFPII